MNDKFKGIRPLIHDEVGPMILDELHKTNAYPMAIALIVIPLVEEGQPGFVTNLSCEDMEKLIISIGEQFSDPTFVASRKEGIPPEFRN